MIALGINSVFHDPAAALIVDGKIVAAIEEERFSRRKHGRDEPTAFAAWELPANAMRWCLEYAGLTATDVDVVAGSYDPSLAPVPSTLTSNEDLVANEWEALRTFYAERLALFAASALPGLDPEKVVNVPHHVAHAASAYLAAPSENSAVLTADGRGESTSGLLGHVQGGELKILRQQPLPHSLGLMYEELTAHLGFRRSSDEYKVMALAAYGKPRYLDALRSRTNVNDGLYELDPIDFSDFAPRLAPGGAITPQHADLACSVQAMLEEVLLELAQWLRDATGESALTMAGGVALNCVANSRLYRESGFDDVWVQPAAGDSGTALGAALYTAHAAGDRIESMGTAALGREWDDDQIAAMLDTARLPYTREPDVAAAVARLVADNKVVGWFEGRSEFGPRALGRRSLLADPRRAENLERMNDIKGREQFRPIAPMVREERAAEIFNSGPLPSPFMLFTHRAHDDWIDRVPAALHADSSARVQTVGPDDPLVDRMLTAFEAITGVPVVINTSFNTAGRPIVDHPRDALECFGSSPIDALAIGSHLVLRENFAAARPEL